MPELEPGMRYGEKRFGKSVADVQREIDDIADQIPSEPDGPVVEPMDPEERFDKAGAAYWYAANYHEGQGSKLYELLSRNPFQPGPLARGPEPDSAEEMYYQELVEMDDLEAEETIERWLNQIEAYDEEEDEGEYGPGDIGLVPPGTESLP